MEEPMNDSVEREQTSDAFLEGLEDAVALEADQAENDAAEKDGMEAAVDGSEPDISPSLKEGGASPSPTGAPRKGEAFSEGEEAERSGADVRQGRTEQSGVSADEVAWTVKHMGQERTMTAGEVTPELLQKGLDYDRVRGKYDEAKPIMELFASFAQQAGMSVADYARHIRQEAHRASGMDADQARRTVELEDREAALRLAEAQKRTEAEEKQQRKASVDADLAQFARAFPEVFDKARSDPKAIPQSVWDEVNGGMSLTAAYSRFAVAQAKAQAEAAEKKAETEQRNAANAARSTGSMRSAGRDMKSGDPFLEGFSN